MRADPKKEAGRWMKQAERDLDDARYADKGKRYNLACFLSQQAGEKAVKAYLYFQGNEEVWGHSVAELCADAEKYDADFGKLKRKGGALDKYYIPTRYPNGLPGGIPADVYRKEDSSQAITLAAEVIEIVRKILT